MLSIFFDFLQWSNDHCSKGLLLIFFKFLFLILLDPPLARIIAKIFLSYHFN